VIRRRLLGALHRRPRLAAWLLFAPGGGFLALFFVVPLMVLAVASVLTRDPYGGVLPGFTLEHWARLGDPVYAWIAARTLGYSAACTLACLALGYPTALAISRAGRWRNWLLFLVVLPFWTSLLVRTFAMIFLMRDSGLINTLLGAVGLPALHLMYTPFAVLVGLVYGFLPFMILPIYTSLEKIDPALLEAAEVLGAPPLARFWRVVWPLSLPGVLAGCLLVFVPAVGSFLTSDLLGGAKQMMLGNLVQNQFTGGRNWPFGSAVSVFTIVAVLAAVLVWLRARGPSADER
jgi:spermidine/putrescine transport system permease protein